MCIGKQVGKEFFMAKNKKRADGRYSCQVYLGKGPDGKRKYKTFYGSTLREARAAADDFRSAVSKGMDPEQASHLQAPCTIISLTAKRKGHRPEKH